MPRTLFVVLSFLFSHIAFAGCGEYTSTCIVIQESGHVERLKCEISQCANMSSYISTWDIPDRGLVHIEAGTEDSSVTIDRVKAHYVSESELPESVSAENTSCVAAEHSETIFCHTE